MEVKSEVLTAVDRVDTKVDKVKIDIAELKMEMKLLENYLES